MAEGSTAGGARQPASRAAQLWAPWRDSYMQLLATAGVAPAPPADADAGCFLRRYWLEAEADEQHHVVVRTGHAGTGRGGLILLNAYPYANGHLLVALGDGRGRLMEYEPEQRAELWSLVDLAVDLCERTLRCQGVNVGVNQGDAAGAGVPEHLHVHVVPRWAGDVNFMSTVGEVRVIPGALAQMAARYRAVWETMRPHGKESARTA